MVTECFPASFLPTFEARFENIAKRAKRLKVEAPTFRVVRTFVATDRHDRPEMYAEVEVLGERPSAGPFEAVANLVSTPEGNLVRAREGFEVPAKYRTRRVCDHCGTKRHRKETWLFRHRETGELVQVGRNCCKDFTGGKLSPAELALWQSAWMGYDPEMCGSGPRGYDVFEFLAYTAATVKVDKRFTSKSRAREEGSEPTANVVGVYIDSWTFDAKGAERAGLPRPDASDYEEAAKALMWLAWADTSKSDYLHNLRAAVSLGYVTDKTAGYVASLVGSAWPRAVADAEKIAKAAESGSDWVGEVKQRAEFTLRVERIRSWEGNYGGTTLFVMRDGNGNRFHWYASGYREDEAQEGAEVRLRGTIKRHSTDRYTAERVTDLTRCAWLKS